MWNYFLINYSVFCVGLQPMNKDWFFLLKRHPSPCLVISSMDCRYFQIFCLLSLFWKNKKRPRRSPCCLCACVCPLIIARQQLGKYTRPMSCQIINMYGKESRGLLLHITFDRLSTLFNYQCYLSPLPWIICTSDTQHRLQIPTKCHCATVGHLLCSCSLEATRTSFWLA
jgi:hypothetical protein